jgi:hypothetical protein
LGIENYHKNVGQLLAQITELPDEETKKQAEVVDKAKLKADYYERFGHALTLPTPTTLDGIWTGPECSLKLESQTGIKRQAPYHDWPISDRNQFIAAGFGRR